MTDFHILIPARLGSTRLTQKALADVAGEPLVVRVWQCAKLSGAASVHVVTDHASIAQAVEKAGGLAVMTSTAHASGTDRLSEAVSALGFDRDAIVVNLQGDEPLMPAVCMRQVARLLADNTQAEMATLFDVIDGEEQWKDPDVVKLLTDRLGKALCFSRAPIPHFRGTEFSCSVLKRHVGLYAYRVSALLAWPHLATSPIELAESLEQWRALEAGWTIMTALASESICRGVDGQADLEAVRAKFSKASTSE